jgi:tRNA 2-thiouridine synthesizing protein B
MSTLNIINKSPFEKRTLEQCLKRIGHGDSVLLIEDASIAAVANTAFAELLLAAAKKSKLYVLQPDLQARGFADASLLDPIAGVDYDGFVELVVSHQRVHSWL